MNIVKSKNYILFSLLMIFISACNIKTEKITTNISLNNNWQFKSKNDSIWRQANVPGVVHLDLLNNSLIPDPYIGNNEEKLQWISKKEWVYTSIFSIDTISDYNNIDLIFDGLDTYADIYLNDSLLFKADNMYRQWTFSVKKLLKQENNKLRIHFFNTDSINNIKAQKLSYTLPEIRGNSRKAPFQFGWDWGAKFLTSGIWKNVYLKAWDNIKLDNINIVQNELSSSNAKLSAELEIYAKLEQSYSIIITDSSNSIFIDSTIMISKGLNKYNFTFNIQNPKLWWCNGMGDANMYYFDIKILQNNIVLESQVKSIGLRNIKLVQKDDSIGKSFYFELNNKAVFIKGANYIPSDIFLTRVDSNDYREIISAATFANMNMLRVWGGGIYESDYFYDLCDKNGILVWQDFMFAGTVYPGDSSFINNIEIEAIQQVKRLRNHPSIALWCGNNEVENAWNDWGWQTQFNYSKEDSLLAWNNYKKVFHKLLPKIVSEYMPEINYWPSSPQFGWGHKENFTHGDSHYWGVWWGKEPFNVFNTKVGRFMSEYGFQALPNIKTIKRFAKNDELNINSPALKAHQKHAIGYEIINEYILRNYELPTDFEKLIYVSQLTQAEGITTAIKAHRRNKPYCMGTLYWQLNDAWPAISWSSIDYFHRKKALHYFIKQAYKNCIISSYNNNGNLEIHLINDSYHSRKITLRIKQYDFYGKELYKETIEDTIPINATTIVFKNHNNNFKDHKTSYLYIELTENGKILDTDFYFFKKPKELILPKCKIDYSITKTKTAYTIKLSSNIFAKNLCIISNIDGEFSDNYFNLNANQSKEISLKTNDSKELKLTFITLNNL